MTCIVSAEMETSYDGLVESLSEPYSLCKLINHNGNNGSQKKQPYLISRAREDRWNKSRLFFEAS